MIIKNESVFFQQFEQLSPDEFFHQDPENLMMRFVMLGRYFKIDLTHLITHEELKKMADEFKGRKEYKITINIEEV